MKAARRAVAVTVSPVFVGRSTEFSFSFAAQAAVIPLSFSIPSALFLAKSVSTISSIHSAGLVWLGIRRPIEVK